MITIEAIKDFDKFLELKPVWNTLLAESDVDAPFLTFEWLSNWWTNFGKGSELLILLVKDGSEIIGMAPLMIRRMKYRSLPVRSVTFMANYYSHRSGLILIRREKEVVSCVLKYLSDYNFDLMYFDFIEKGSATDTSLGSVLDAEKMRHVRWNGEFSPYIAIDGTWECFLDEKTKSFRKDIKHTNNLFNRGGRYEVIKYSNTDIDYAIAQLFTISENTWKFANGTAIINNEKSKMFYRSLAYVAASNNWLNIYILKLYNQPIAFGYCLRYGEKIYSLKIGYDKRYAELSPGKFLSMYTIKDAFENCLKEYDFLGANEARKLQWTPLIREHYKYYIFNNNLYGKSLYAFESRIISKLKKNDWVRGFYSRLQMNKTFKEGKKKLPGQLSGQNNIIEV